MGKHEFNRGQLVFKIPDYRRFYRLNYQTSGDRPQPYNYAWVVGPDGEFYRYKTRDGETEVKDKDHAGEFRASWTEALQAALADIKNKVQVVEEIVKKEVKKYCCEEGLKKK